MYDTDKLGAQTTDYYFNTSVSTQTKDGSANFAVSSGKVGIGTNLPQGKLDISGGVSVGSYAGNNTPPVNGLIVSSNVGIGTSTPDRRLDVNGGAVIRSSLTMKNKKRFLCLLSLLVIFSSISFSVIRGNDGYEITSESINSGGRDRYLPNLKITDSIGQTSIASSQYAGYEIRTGFINTLDHIAPNEISDLTATVTIDSINVILTWTSPGNDGTVGAINQGKYYLKYSSISTDTWDSMQYSITWSTSTSFGSIESKIIYGLRGNTSYYFFIKIADESNNWSILSNKTTFWLPDNIPPAPVTDLTAVKDFQIKLTWTTPGDDENTGDVVGGKVEIRYTRFTYCTVDDAENDLTYNSDFSPGTQQSRIILELMPRSTYYFWIRIADEVGNWSIWSSSVSATAESFGLIWAHQANSNPTKGNISCGDYDNDGEVDIGTPQGIIRNNGNTTFDFLTEVAGINVSDTSGISWGDYNNDGYLDFIRNSLSLLKNNGNGTFNIASTIDISGGNGIVKWGDYNNDGLLDFITSDGYVYKNNGNNTFSLVWQPPINENPKAVAISDFDNDGNLDIAVANSGYSSRVYRNVGNDNFVSISTISSTDYSNDIAWGDYNNDGDLDIAVANNLQPVKVYRNDGNGNFTLVWLSTEIERSESIAWGDYDIDGLLDLVVTNYYPDHEARIYRSNGDNTFSSVVVFPVGDSSGYKTCASWADLFHIGALDLCIVDGGHIFIYMSFEYLNSLNSIPNSLNSGFGTQYNSSSKELNLRWNLGSDDRTPQNGLYYSVRASTELPITDTNARIVSWYPATPFLGNYPHGFVSTGTQPGLNLKPPFVFEAVNYYWQVRSIDTGFRTSLWSDTTSYYFQGVSPANVTDLKVAPISKKGNLILTWTAPGDDDIYGDITNGKYEIKYSTYLSGGQILGTVINWSTNTILGKLETKVISGLFLGTTYYFQMRTTDEVLNWSDWTNISSTQTYYVSESTDNAMVSVFYLNATLQGQTTSVSILVEPKTSPKATVALSSAAAVGKTAVGNLYDIQPDSLTFIPPAILTFYYTEPLPIGVSENSLNVYEWFPSQGWQPLTALVRNTIENWIEVKISSAYSMFGLLSPMPPTAITDLYASGSNQLTDINLSWTAPGNNGRVGIINSGKYGIQYSTWTGVTWSTTSVNIIISTSNVNPGDWQGYTVTGLNIGFTYYFRIWTANEEFNWSEISNGATFYLAPIREFVCTIKQSTGTGVDYTSLSGWQSAIKCNLTVSRVFSHGGITGSIPDGSTVWGAVSGSTGTVTHVTSSQALIKNISGAFLSGEQVYKNKDVNYITISDCGSSAIAVAKIDGDWTSPDTNTLTFEGWTTSLDNYIRIYTAPEARHNGHWDTATKYRISVSEAYQGAINWMWWSGGAAHVRIDGIQIENTADATGSNSPMGIRDNFDTPASGITCVHELSNCIFKWTGSGTPDNWYNCAVMLEPSTGTIKLWNNISIDFPNFAMNGWVTSGSTFCIYNNTVVYPAAPSASQFLGIHINGAANECKLYLKNNIVQRAGTSGTCYELDNFTIQELENNISNDATSPNDDYDNTTVSFVAGANGYFLLASTDTAAVNQGVDLSTDTVLAFNTDIKGNVRPAGDAWDIGADEMIPDNTAPAAITTLTASTGTAEGSIELSWLSPGDDGTSGQIANGKWLIAYSTNSNYQFTIENYQLQITTTILPLTACRYTLAGLTGNATYYFRIWTLDESSNYSGISNGATFYVGYSLNAGLVGHWKLDETSGSSAADSSGNGSNGTLYGNSAWTSLGRIDGGIYFDGSGDYINMGDPGSGVLDFGAGQDFSLSVWFRSDGGAAYENLLSKGDGYTGSDGWTLRDDWDVSYIGFRNNDKMLTTDIGGWFDRSWHQVVVSVDRDENTRIYMDGVLEGTYASSNWNSSFSNAYNFQLGRRSAYGDEYFKGYMDDVRVYNRALSAGEVECLYSAAPAPVEFVSVIEQSAASNVDFTNLAAWQSCIKCNLTTSKVFSVTNQSNPGIQSNRKVFGQTSNSTGTVVHVSSAGTQVLIKSITGKFQNGEKIFEDGSGGSARWAYLGDAGYLPIATAKIDGTWTSADTNRLDFSGWTTSADNYIRIYTSTEARHSGHWNTTAKYRISVSEAYQGAINWPWWSYTAHVRIDGLQIENTANATGSNNPMGISDRYNTPASGMLCMHELSNCIFKWTGGGTPDNWNNCAVYISPSTGTVKVWNNISIDFPNFVSAGGIGYAGGKENTFCIYNNTVVNPGKPGSHFLGIMLHSDGNPDITNVYLKNNIVQRTGTSGTCYDLQTFTDKEYEHNISNDASSPNNDYDNKTVSFENGAAGYFLLASTDTSAKNQGVNLSTDTRLAFSTDINGDNRPFGSAWDIGADEFTDFVAPAVIADFNAETNNEGAGRINLTWTSPGDDGTTGAITNGKFKIQYSTITDIQWGYQNAQVIISTTCDPLTSNFYKLTGLTQETTYYFRIWTCDGTDNYSELSNGTTAWADCEGGMGMFVVIGGPDPTFRLGEVYSYPNPSKNGIIPTIHAELGIADKVVLKIYNIAGERVHSADITDYLSIVQGRRQFRQVYAYEYAWNIRDIASGVYIYLIYAEKSGEQPIKVMKKLAVIK